MNDDIIFDDSNLIATMLESIKHPKNGELTHNPKPFINKENNNLNSSKDSLPKDFISIAKKQIETYLAKNADYGSATQKLFNEYGIDYYLIMIEQKLLRIKSVLNNNKANNESIEDSFLDLANYAILAVESLRNQK